ncbi:hypothetical protein J690_0744 [Acinetobacter sp. 742879]|nr:hypothetical protein J690_0744 [Acinetobacter sp. 742879]
MKTLIYQKNKKCIEIRGKVKKIINFFVEQIKSDKNLCKGFTKVLFFMHST